MPKRRRWWKWTRRILIGAFALTFIAVAAVLIFREVRKSQGEKELAAVNLRPVPYEFFLYYDL